MKKSDYIKVLSKTMVSNWVLTGYKGNAEKAIKTRSHQLQIFTIKELKIKLDNLTIRS